MKKLFLISALCFAAYAAPSEQDFHTAVTHPTKVGVYSLGHWSYRYSIRSAGTRSEGRTGRLFYDGSEIKGTTGSVLTTPLGRFAYFADPGEIHGWGCFGWLMTLTYDEPLWASDGKVTAEFARNQSGFVGRMREIEMKDILPQGKETSPTK